jgi:hypothetical protein
MFRILASFTALMLALSPLVATAETPPTPEAWLAKMLDGKRNGAAFKDPAAFAEWLDAITEPRFMTALAVVASEPGTYPKIMADAIDPAAARNWSEFTDPQLYLRWMLASTTPSFQQAIIKKLSDPAKLKRWIEAANNESTHSPILANFAKSPSAWMLAPSSPITQSTVAKALQPGLPIAWAGALLNGIRHPPVANDRGWLTLPDAPKAYGAPRHRY